MKYFSKIVILVLVVLGLAFFVFYTKNQQVKTANQAVEKPLATYTKSLEIAPGATYSLLMQQAGVATTTVKQIFNATLPVYDLSKIKSSNKIDLIYNQQTNELQQLIYKVDTEEELIIKLQASTSTNNYIWWAEIKPISYEIKIKTASGVIDSSLYASALAQGLDERAVISFADAFQWTIDFAWEVQKGDSYKFIYEERYRNGQYIMPGQVLAGKFVNAGKTLYAFYYQESFTNQGFFDEQGQSAQKIFLKAPLAFKYISSAFTTGSRYIFAFNISTGHRAVDYAATYGTPIRAVGDGTVTFAGWNGSYGNTVKIRHNGTYSTNYGHMSKIAVRAGSKVKQGQTIGYVGSTGLSTGPHLHYEMVKYGTKINPLREVFPPSQGIKEENKSAYLAAITPSRQQLDQ